MKNLIKLASVIFIALFCSRVANADPANDSAIILTFEGLKNQEAIRDFYNGGSGSKGSKNDENYGIWFSSNALAIIDSDAGGTGNFGNEPSPDTIMFFLTGNGAVLNAEKGFDTGFSFYYSAVNNPGKVVIYDGLNAQGTALATINLPVTQRDGGDPNGDFSPFIKAGVNFPGTARSIDFGGTINQIGFDDITFGSVTPGMTAKIPFMVADFETNPIHSARTTSQIFDGTDLKEGFDPSLPTYVVTHGWQNDQGKYNEPEFNFAEKQLPDGQQHISAAIKERLNVEDSKRQQMLEMLTSELENNYEYSLIT